MSAALPLRERARPFFEWPFFGWVYALSLPIWAVSPFVHSNLLPDHLPLLDAVGTFVATIAACILVYRHGHLHDVKQLLLRAFDARREKRPRYWVFSILIMPLLFVVAYIIMLRMGLITAGTWTLGTSTLVTLLVFLIAAAGEEIGYTGYATDRLIKHYSLWQVSLLVGLLHALWHYPSMIQIGQSAGLILTGTLFTIAVRTVMVWLYRETGSVCLIILFHAIGNTARSCFPGGRAAFEQHHAIVGYGLVVITALIMVIIDVMKNRSSAQKDTNY